MHCMGVGHFLLEGAVDFMGSMTTLSRILNRLQWGLASSLIFSGMCVFANIYWLLPILHLFCLEDQNWPY